MKNTHSLKPSILLALLLSLAPLSANAQLYFREPDPDEHLGLEWTYFASFDSPYSAGVRIARGDTLVLNVGSRVKDHYRMLYTTDLGNNWDTLSSLAGGKSDISIVPFLPYPNDLHQGVARLRYSDTTVHFIQTRDFGKTVDTVLMIPKEMSTFAYQLRAKFGGGWWSSVDPQKMWVVFPLDDGEFSTDFYGRSRDGGKTWYQVANLPRPLSGRGARYTFLFDQRDSDIWYVQVEPVIDHSGPIQRERYMTKDDGRTFSQITQWAPLAGIAKAGDMRAWSKGPEDRIGDNSSYYEIKGFNSYLPTEDGSSPPVFTNLIDKIVAQREGYKRSLNPAEVIGAPPTTYFVGVTESYKDSVLVTGPEASLWALVTRDDGKTFDTLTKRTPNGITSDPLTGRIWIRIYQGEYNITNGYPRTDIFYSDKWRHLFRSVSSVEGTSLGDANAWTTGGTVIRGVESQFVLRLDRQSHVEVELVDELGRHVNTHFNAESAIGDHSIVVKIDTTLAPGIYFLIAKLDGKSLTKKLLVL